MKGIIIIKVILICVFLYGCKKDKKADRIIQSSITICDQTWMSKNLDVGNYKNGDPIPQVEEQGEWMNLTTGAWCWYNNDSAEYGSIYGKLYNWYAVNDPRGLAPQGWHIPTDDEWTKLSTCLGGDAAAGGKLKETGTSHWLWPNGEATNETGFTALPGERRPTLTSEWPIPISQSILGGFGNWWSSTENVPTHAFYRKLNNVSGYFYREITGERKTDGYSVRCVKD